MRSAFTAAPVFFTEHYAIEDRDTCPFFVMDAHFDLESLDPLLFQRPDYLWIQPSFSRLTTPNEHAICMAIRANLLHGETFSDETILEFLRSSELNDVRIIYTKLVIHQVSEQIRHTFTIPHGNPPHRTTFLLKLLQLPHVTEFIVEDNSVILSAVLPMMEASIIDDNCYLCAGLGDEIAQQMVRENSQEDAEDTLLNAELSLPHFAIRRIREIHERIVREGDNEPTLVLPENVIQHLHYLQLDAFSTDGIYNQLFEDTALMVMHDYDEERHAHLRDLTTIGRRDALEMWVERRMMDFREDEFVRRSGTQENPITLDETEMDLWDTLWGEREMARHNPITDIIALRTNLPHIPQNWIQRHHHEPMIDVDHMRGDSEVEFVSDSNQTHVEQIEVDSDSSEDEFPFREDSEDEAPHGRSPGGSRYFGARNIGRRARAVHEAVCQQRLEAEGSVATARLKAAA
ncbi:hypothetical protein K435DRAFT_865857 [Dendrothele bispora CBS 962.96]|uniref:Uncharacterized protein n=1 Tax=Dendrothele bispora (strain CBS 962.96) TaxID=1314807 RepID=A0A4S8LJQ3_DENBC|nr:hypothetical protein K435DRAFT_865857 [Dendrothele bispora CBS 962.96]